MVRHVSPDVPTVMLVDSTQDDRTMYAECLRIDGLNPIEVDNTADALRVATSADVGPDQSSIGLRQEAVAEAVTMAERDDVRAWLTTDDSYDFVLRER